MSSEKALRNIRVAILATNGFEQAELIDTRKALDEAGAQMVVIAPPDPKSGAKPAKIQSMKHDEKADFVNVDLALDQADPSAFDALLSPGGALNADNLRVQPQAQAFARSIDHQSKPIAVICHGPRLLVSAGLVKGRTLTSYHTIQDDIRNAGGKWVDEEVARDRNWVSSRQPTDIPAFNKAMVQLFAQPKEKAQRA